MVHRTPTKRQLKSKAQVVKVIDDAVDHGVRE
jgi:hypothetical protein